MPRPTPASRAATASEIPTSSRTAPSRNPSGKRGREGAEATGARTDVGATPSVLRPGIGRYKRRAPELDDAITAAYVEGVSTRDMSRVTQALMGEGVSHSTVSRVTKRLEDGVESLRKAPISGPMPYLYLDATFLDARWARTVEKVSALVAYGVGEDGHRHLLGVSIGAQESEDSWSELHGELLERGLAGVKARHRGRPPRPHERRPEAPPRGTAPALHGAPRTERPHEGAPAAPRTRGEGGERHLRRARPRRGEEAPRGLPHGPRLAGPRGARLPRERFAAGTQFSAFPKEHWPRIRSTNGLERLHGEVKRRTRAVGAFPDRASPLRLIVAVATQVTRVWSDRRYLDMSLLSTPSAPASTKRVRSSKSKVA